MHLFEKISVVCQHAITLPKRKQSIKKYLYDHHIKKLHLGCGTTILPSWLNSDLFGNNKRIFLDAAKRFPFPNNTFDYVFSEHLIEHLTYAKGMSMLQECFRVLKKGGKIRVATPDLSFLIFLHQPKKSELQQRYIKWATNAFIPSAPSADDAFVINNFFRAWGHRFIYDKKILQQSLQTAGFTSVTTCKPSISSDPVLCSLEQHGHLIGNAFNLLETMVLEGKKR